MNPPIEAVIHGPRAAVRSGSMSRIDVVVVSYNSRSHLRSCISPLAAIDGVRVIVVDNASSDGSLETVADLPVTKIRNARNRGFAAGCNIGAQVGDRPAILFLNPDARIDERSLDILAAALDGDRGTAAVAPRIELPDGRVAWSQRRYPRLRSTYARAFFLHRLFPGAAWADDIVRDPDVYEAPSSPDWLSGAVLLIRRSAFDEIGGWDEDFFLYGEDIDICRRLRGRGYDVRYEPAATATHAEGASAPRTETLPLLAESRIRYDHKHRGRIACVVDRVGIGLGALTHVIVSRGGLATRASHIRTIGVALRPGRTADKRAGL